MIWWIRHWLVLLEAEIVAWKAAYQIVSKEWWSR